MNSKYVLQVWTTLPSPPPTHIHILFCKRKKKKKLAKKDGQLIMNIFPEDP